MKCQCENASHHPKGCGNRATKVVTTHFGRYELCSPCVHDHLFNDMPSEERATAVIFSKQTAAKGGTAE